jgi:hypothetical protein
MAQPQNTSILAAKNLIKLQSQRSQTNTKILSKKSGNLIDLRAATNRLTNHGE